MRIAIDIDSTLHHYWDRLSEVSRRRFGIELPYDEQLTWGVTRLRPEQLRLCIEETHSEREILAGRPYPGAVETVRAWHDSGHYIHITSHRDPRAREATARWLEQIGLPHDDVYCSFDKVSRCVEISIDVLVDDSPMNLASAAERGITVATLRHPWNEDICDEEDVISARSWSELARLLDPVLSGGSRVVASRGA